MSAAAGSIATVEAAAAVWASLRFEPMVAKSVAAEVIISGAAITYDMSVHLLASPWLSLARRSPTRQNSKDSRRSWVVVTSFRRNGLVAASAPQLRDIEVIDTEQRSVVLLLQRGEYQPCELSELPGGYGLPGGSPMICDPPTYDRYPATPGSRF